MCTVVLFLYMATAINAHTLSTFRAMFSQIEIKTGAMLVLRATTVKMSRRSNTATVQCTIRATAAHAVFLVMSTAVLPWHWVVKLVQVVVFPREQGCPVPETPTTTARSATLAPGRCHLFLKYMLVVYHCDNFQDQRQRHISCNLNRPSCTCFVLLFYSLTPAINIHTLSTFVSMVVPVGNIPMKQRAWPKIPPVNFAKRVSTPPSKRPMPLAIAKHAWRGSTTTAWAPTATACAKNARPAKPNDRREKRIVCPVHQGSFNPTLVP